MAVTKIWTIYYSLSGAVDYVANEEKTSTASHDIADLETIPEEDSSDIVIEDMAKAIKYISQDKKTHAGQYVSGINCNGETALYEMTKTKELYDKTDGAIAYHCIQSFVPGEVDPDKAHLIGLETAQELWGDEGYQVLVCTHIDRAHIHNHFIINSVNSFTGEKNPCCYHRKISSVSDRIVQEHGLSVISDPGIEPSELPRLSKRQRYAKEDIDDVIRQANNVQEFVRMLKDRGYKVSTSTKRAYWTIQHSSWKRPLRMVRLGEEYSNGSILERIANEKQLGQKDSNELSPKQEYIIRCRIERINRNWKNTYQYQYFMFMLKMGINISKFKKHPRNLSYKEQEDMKKYWESVKFVSYLSEQGITTPEQLQNRKIICEHKLAFVKKQRERAWYRVRSKRSKDMDFSEEQKEVDKINDEINALKDEIRMIEDALNNSGYSVEYDVEHETDYVV